MCHVSAQVVDESMVNVHDDDDDYKLPVLVPPEDGLKESLSKSEKLRHLFRMGMYTVLEL